MAVNTRSSRLREAIRLNDLSLTQRILKIEPRLLYNHSFNDKADTSLHIAASLGLTSIVQYLIGLGHDETAPANDDLSNVVDLNRGISVNTDGRTPLHLASANLHSSVVNVLCKAFPTTINRKDNQGQTALLLAAGAQAKVTTTVSSTPTVKTSTRATEDISTISTLLEFGADVAAKDLRGNTCLHNACAYGNLKAIRVLLQAGADPRSVNLDGWKPELYSLTVQAEVYYRNLVAEVGKRKAEEKRLLLERSGKTGGSVRLVAQDDDESDDADSLAKRSRADSGRSHSTFESAMS